MSRIKLTESEKNNILSLYEREVKTEFKSVLYEQATTSIKDRAKASGINDPAYFLASKTSQTTGTNEKVIATVFNLVKSPNDYRELDTDFVKFQNQTIQTMLNDEMESDNLADVKNYATILGKAGVKLTYQVETDAYGNQDLKTGSIKIDYTLGSQKPQQNTNPKTNQQTATFVQAPTFQEACQGTKIIQYGMKGESVGQVQTIIGLTGAKNDKKFGNETRQALMNWQKKNGVTPVSGKFGKTSCAKYGELFKKEIGMSKPSMTDDNTSDSDIAALNTPSNTNQNLASNSPKRTTPSSNNLDD
jgi:hypothetical protein